MLAELNFIRAMVGVPSIDISGRGGTNLKLDTRQVELADADAQDPAPSLASHRFGAVSFSASLPDKDIDPAYRKHFASLCAAAVKQETGARVVMDVPMAVQIRRSDAADPRAPICVSHADYTPGSTARRVAELLANLGKKIRPTRFAVYNNWWLARSGPQDRPLALCDATSIAAADVQMGTAQVVGTDNSPMNFGEVAFQRYSPRHRWYWYPQLAPDRLLLFCGFDSDSSRPSMVTHCAFSNPECPPGAPPRISVECRCFAFW